MEDEDLTSVRIDSLRVKQNVGKKAEKLEARCRYMYDAHLNAAIQWRLIYYLLGMLTVAMSLILSLTAFDKLFGGDTAVIKLLSIVVTVSAALNTFLSPKEMSDSHYKAGIKYEAIKNEASKLSSVDIWLHTSPNQLAEKLGVLIASKADADKTSPQVRPLSLKAMKAVMRLRAAIYNSERRRR